MKVKTEYTDEDINVLEVLDDPVWFGEFIRSDDDYSWEMDEYQRLVLLDRSTYISMCCGRSIGKTICIETMLIHDAFSDRFKNSGENEILLVVPNKVHLDPLFQRIANIWRKHYLLRQYINRDSINYSRTEIRLTRPDGTPGPLIRCRIAGTATGDANIVGLHVPKVMIDEAQLFPYAAWNSVQQCLISRDDELQLVLSGVPNGMREKNILYEADMVVDSYKRYRIPRLHSGRYRQAEHNRDLKQYGGTESDDYLQLILGRHGSPSFSVFDRKLMKIQDYNVELSKLTDYFWTQEKGEFHRLIIAPDIPSGTQYIVAGIDLGFSNDPSIVSILYMINDVWRILARVTMQRIKYPDQARVIDWLDNAYGFNMICIDAGSAGVAVGQMLTDANGPYAGKEYDKRIFMVDFQGTVTVGQRDDGKDIKERVRKFTIQELQKWLQQEQRLILSSMDDELINELERVGFIRDTLGQPRYFVYSPTGSKNGEDHILASLLTWVYGYYFKYMYNNTSNKTRKYSELAPGGWYTPLRGSI